MRQVTIHAAKTHLSKLIEAALNGEEVIIAKDGKPVVRLIPISRGGFKIGILEGKLDAGPDFLPPMAEDELDLWEGGR
ncbi:type II toxin-antitoxin system prevent-host-death family antitoxin [Nitrospirillum sp. BR 11164]|uniref:type II toxin-antitoxin system Phd/YefM family antitoxin n=1 Tax=Nitrospirillum sp. BR 11164 TaxID=3104324 RepID=UPI002AFDFE7A|nr:type II toxin-antitoxin system prevent-host-death family antitoxin [Nitrospirillum sp. BR 11164]MEA1650949.1 type II toxin-antitoxin system prevent-host-death family antitoxin [Nitrospirillum sp. BR 11164]